MIRKPIGRIGNIFGVTLEPASDDNASTSKSSVQMAQPNQDDSSAKKPNWSIFMAKVVMVFKS